MAAIWVRAELFGWVFIVTLALNEINLKLWNILKSVSGGPGARLLLHYSINQPSFLIQVLSKYSKKQMQQ